jgi:hypothetical protein
MIEKASQFLIFIYLAVLFLGKDKLNNDEN